ncbi:hypothetical protein RHGRI_020309 [Rhododendron griersonianum]|uniref:Uncharacterized protein n=1 Tax=Rhododendron griersonianum TaxID=479676 RepID=A0AAV6JKF5_9ERIC|nr:hypothetical protein RHGRI_020309 [Rhododendron griersonianum]
MAASSPALSNNSPAATPSPSPATPASISAAALSSTNASKNLRGLNKPKCIKCGNVARSSPPTNPQLYPPSHESSDDPEWSSDCLAFWLRVHGGVEMPLGKSNNRESSNSMMERTWRLESHTVESIMVSFAEAQASSWNASILSKIASVIGKPLFTDSTTAERGRLAYALLKTNATFTDKTQSSSSPLFDQQSTEASPSGNSHRFSSLRQLSNNFAQFNNLQSPLRSRKPLTRKDAAVINEWRFKKLKEYKEGNIEVENEAFDRYMQNVTLLEEVLAVNPKPEGSADDGSLDSNPNRNSAGDDTETVVSGLKLKLRSNPVRTEKLRKRLEDIINQGLRKLQKIDLDGGNDPNKQDELVGKQENEKYSALSDLLDKLNKARSEEDLKSCLEMKSQLFNRHRKSIQTETEGIKVSKESAKTDLPPGLRSDYSPPKWFCTATIEQDALDSINVHFSSLEEVETL